jgi:hypothetical protein
VKTPNKLPTYHFPEINLSKPPPEMARNDLINAKNRGRK